MKIYTSLFIGILICFSAASCSKENRVEVTGTIQQIGATTYQYGTHTIAGYALTSSSLTLDNYVNQQVTIVGKKIDGYPLSGGPDYLEVEQIK